jgi:solute:Na+ symporter, SSS family
MPPVASGIFLAALFGAAMSMLASDLNCLAVILVEDHYRLFVPNSTDKQRLRMGRIMVVCCGALAVGVSLLLRDVRGGALGVYYAVTAVVAGGLAGLFLLAFLMRRAGRKAALSAIGVSLAFTIYATLTLDNGKFLNLRGWNYPWHADTVGAAGSVLLLVVGVVFTMIFPEPHSGSSLTLWQWLEDRRASTCNAEVSISGSR